MLLDKPDKQLKLPLAASVHPVGRGFMQARASDNSAKTEIELLIELYGA